MTYRTVDLDGLSPDEVLALPDDWLDGLVLCGEPLVFRAGTADILGRFWVADGSLVLELGHIDGGGEGVLPTIAVLAERVARRRGLTTLDWRVLATNCAHPNLKLRRVLERRGFVVEDVPGTGACYHLVQLVGHGVNTAAGQPLRSANAVTSPLLLTTGSSYRLSVSF